MLSAAAQAVIVGAGHNGLVAATLLARAGLAVTVLERDAVIGGAVRTEYPFKRAPRVGQSTGAYLLGLMPPELLLELGLDLPLLRRDPHYFLPTLDDRYLLLGSDPAVSVDAYARFFSGADQRADTALQAELAALRQDLAPSWLQPPRSIADTAERFVRPALRETFVDLCRGSVGNYLQRFGFDSELIQAMYAVTDGFTGLDGGWDSPGTGMNFLIHNMCRLPGANGTWMVVAGGMGTLTARLRELAVAAGVTIYTEQPVVQIDVAAGVANAVITADGRRWAADAIVCNADPFHLLRLLGSATPAELTARIERYRRPGTTMKINLCLRDLPRFACLPEDRGQHRATIHLLPQHNIRAALNEAYTDASTGRLPAFPSIEWYIHTTLDPSLRDEAGRHSSALFVQWVPYRPAAADWSALQDDYARQLLSICDRFAPGTSDLVEDMFILTPPAIEAHFGMSHGHIHHVDNSFGFDQRLPYRLPLQGLYACGAGCHPGGSVIGAAGHNAAQVVLGDLAVLQ